MSTPQLSILASVYQGEVYLPAYLAEVQQQSLFRDVEIIFVCNQPSADELNIIQAFRASFPDQVQIHAVERETLGASWNRAWAAARAPLLAIWNIDDRREPDSLKRQVSAMQGTDWVLCYGDYVTVKKYGAREGQLRHTPAYTPAHFARSFAQGGAFWVFRRDVYQRIGHFDEQFRTAADMDLSLRMAANGLPMGRVDGVLGYFTDASQGLSTREGGQEALVERTAVQMRYGVFDKVPAEFKEAAQRFRLEAVLNFGQWHQLAEWVPDYSTFLRNRKPLWLVGKLRFAARAVLARLGLLRWLQTRLKREI